VKFKTDENLPLEAASILREAGFPCETVRDELCRRCRPDHHCANTGRRPDTGHAGSGFSNIQAYAPDQYIAIIVLRPKTQDKATVVAYIHRPITLLRERTPARELWIVQRERICVRQVD
jgi:hypothetical protein